jgi:hypothetical protein
MAGFIGGCLHASTVISCSTNTSLVSSCSSNNLPVFESQLDWAIFGNPTGSTQNLWTANMGGGMSVSVSSESAAGLRTADNFGQVHFGGYWVAANLSFPPPPIGPAAPPFYFPGHFDWSTSNPYGESLMGLVTMPNPTAGFGAGDAAMNISFSKPVTDFGFSIAGAGGSCAGIEGCLFGVTMRVYDINNHLIFDSSTQATNPFANLAGGGACSALTTAIVSDTSPPAGCNNAPYLGYSGSALISRIQLLTTDSKGFYIGGVGYTAVPEPASVLLTSGGILLFAYARRRRRA